MRTLNKYIFCMAFAERESNLFTDEIIPISSAFRDAYSFYQNIAFVQ